MNLLPRTATLILATVFSCTNNSFAQDISEIIRKSENAIKGKTSHGTFEMTVVTPDYSRKLVMESWWKGTEKALIVVNSPPKEKGNKTLKIGTEMWSYLRNTETTIKIPPSMMLQSWNGSDFTNDDLVRESDLTDDYSQELIAKEELDGVLCWRIRLTPEPDLAVVWGRIDYWVRTGDFLPAKQEYFDEKNVLVRTMLFQDIATVGGRKIPRTWKMINNRKVGRTTTFRIVDAEFDTNISDRIFTLRELER